MRGVVKLQVLLKQPWLSLSLSFWLNIHAMVCLAMTCTNSGTDLQNYKLYCIAKGDVHQSSDGVTHLTSNTLCSMT